LPLGGAANQGVLFVPEVGAGVWVEFEEGDLEFPVWVGTYWSKPNGDSEAPKPNDADGAEQDAVQSPPTRKIIKTLKGHTIQFEDADGGELVILVDGVNGHVLVMDKEGIKITDGVNGHEFVLDGDGVSVTDGVTSGNLLKMASDAVTLESAGDVLIKGINVTIEASGKLEAKGNPIHLNP
jgi:uncharacterized protein involved in type VI secretion and phage assembly